MLRGKKRRAKIKRKSKDERGDEASWLTLDVEVLSFTQFHAPRGKYVVTIAEKKTSTTVVYKIRLLRYHIINSDDISRHTETNRRTDGLTDGWTNGSTDTTSFHKTSKRETAGATDFVCFRSVL